MDIVKCMKSCTGICYHQKFDIKHSHHLKIYFVALSGWLKLVVALSHTPKVAGSISGKGACRTADWYFSLPSMFFSTRPPLFKINFKNISLGDDFLKNISLVLLYQSPAPPFPLATIDLLWSLMFLPFPEFQINGIICSLVFGCFP